MSEYGYQGEGASLRELYQGLLERQPYPEPQAPPRVTTPPDPGYPAGKTMLFHDWEWYCELDVRQYGTSRSSRHHSFDPLMCSYAFNDEAVKQWVPEEGQKMPSDLRDALRDPDVIKSCWNKPAEYCTWKGGYGIDIPHEQWRDTMVLALSLSLPGSLAKAGEVIGLPLDKRKDSRGKALIRIFSKPNVPTKKRPWERRSWITDPDEWEEFKSYNIGDTESERAIYRRLRKYDLPAHEWDLWHIDQHINEAGLPINMDVVRNALRVNDEITSKRLAEMAKITDLKNPNSGAQLLPWLKEQGYPYNDLKKGHVTRALADIEARCDDPATEAETREYRRTLELRQEVSKASVKKYNALEQATDDDGLLRYTLQFAGAGRTWRWAGRKYQAQNLARPAWWLEKTQEDCVRDLEFLDAEQIEWLYPKPMDLLSTCVRPVVQAPKGYVFADADLNAIENRVLGWIANDRKILSVFENGRDPYIDFAKYMYERPYEELFAEYKAGDKTKRTVAKPGVLGCGYMLGPGEERENHETGEVEATGLLGYAWNMGVKLTLDLSQKSVKVWRSTYEDAVEFWRDIDRAARKCIRTGDESYCGGKDGKLIRFDRSGPFMRMRLPSGRHLHYCRPRIEEKRTPWGEVRPTITYEGLNDKNQWTRIGTHPGKLTENADQAIARDLLAHGIVLAHKRGLDVRLHVHDQILACVPEKRAEASLAVLQACMREQPKWARGCPLDSAGFISKFFIKD